jgi:hypothetical protein
MVRRFISAAFFASAFVWVAVSFFDVETEVVWVFFVFSIGFVVLMMLVRFLFVPVISLFRKKRSSLLEGTILEESDDTKEDKHSTDGGTDQTL